MLARLLHILLIVTIAVCPVWCSVGLCDGCEDCGVASPCSSQTAGCCGHEPTGNRESPPSRPDRGEPSICQCICGGAVVEQPTDALSDGKVAWLAAVATHQPVATRLAQVHEVSWCIWGLSSATPGRSMRTVHMSFLC